jgi:hypothetical protein
MVEFQMHPTQSDCQQAALVKFWSNRALRIYCALTCLSLLASIVCYNYGPDFAKPSAEVLGFLIFLALITPFVAVLGMARRDFKSRSPHIDEYTFRIGEQGFGWKSPTTEASFSWAEARAIYETKKFLVIRLRRGGFFTVFKERISLDMLASVREIIYDAPVENKKVLL